MRGALAVGTRDPGRELGVDDLKLLGEVAWLSGAALAGQDRRAEVAGTVASQVDALATALSVWDGRRARHSDTVVELARRTGARMGLDHMELLELELAALLHDVGKLRVPRELLRKPAPLSDSEERLMRTHAAWGAELVSGVPGLQAVALIVRHHHERVDGSGYPNRLAGVHIPVASRIMAVCDTYGAMTSRAPTGSSASRTRRSASCATWPGTVRPGRGGPRSRPRSAARRSSWPSGASGSPGDRAARSPKYAEVEMPRSKSDQRAPVRQRALDAVEAPERAAQVVDEVHERGLARARHDRAAVLELAVVAQDDVQDASASGFGKPSSSSMARRTM